MQEAWLLEVCEEFRGAFTIIKCSLLSFELQRTIKVDLNFKLMGVGNPAMVFGSMMSHNVTDLL
jgi:hypothetical protein